MRKVKNFERALPLPDYYDERPHSRGANRAAAHLETYRWRIDPKTGKRAMLLPPGRVAR